MGRQTLSNLYSVLKADYCQEVKRRGTESRYGTAILYRAASEVLYEKMISDVRLEGSEETNQEGTWEINTAGKDCSDCKTPGVVGRYLV